MPGGWRMLGWVSASCLIILIVHLTGTDLSVLLLGGISLAGIWHIAQPWRGKHDGTAAGCRDGNRRRTPNPGRSPRHDR